MRKKIEDVFARSLQLVFDETSKFVMMSDCHRGDGSESDNFIHNSNIFYAAMQRYYEQGFTYIELGDGDEMWQNKNFPYIASTNENIFKLLNKMYINRKLYLIYGNHDMVKSKKKWVEKNLSHFSTEFSNTKFPLFPDIDVHEGIVLIHADSENKILLLHGHQVDFINSTLWKISRFLVRYLWSPIEHLGIKDPFSTSNSHSKKMTIEKHLVDYSMATKQMVIAGHTHREIFPDLGEPLYFNDGSCVNFQHITAIEIEFGKISLVKWSIQTKEDGTLYVGKEILKGPTDILDYFNMEPVCNCLECWTKNR